MQTAADLNANADAIAALYDGGQVALYNADPGIDGSNLADGGDGQTVTFTPGGDEGPTSDHAPIDGMAWSTVVYFDLNEKATHFGLIVGGQFRRGAPLPAPLGPGETAFSFGVGPAAE